MTTFHIGDLISVSTGRLVAPGGIADVHRLVEHLADGPVWTHQLPDAMDALAPGLIGQHPWLAGIRPPGEFTDEAHIWRWLDGQIAAHGEHHEVTPVEGGWARNPITDLLARFGPDSVLVVETP